MPAALQAFLVAFGVVFLAELPDKTMFATIVLSTRYRRPVAVVVGVTLAMIVHSVLAVVVGEALRQLPRLPTQLAVAAVFLVGGVMLLRGSDDDAEIETAPVSQRVGRGRPLGGDHRHRRIRGLHPTGHRRQSSPIAGTRRLSLPARSPRTSQSAILAVLAGKWLEQRLPVRTVQRLAGGLFILFGVLTVTSAIRG